MPKHSFTEVSHNSWLSRIGGAIMGVLIGIILFLVAFPLLFWNEGRALERHKTLREGGRAVISVASDRVDAANAGKLIHLTGMADTAAILTDPVFGVSANAIKLMRVVEMYQWKETSESKTQKKMGGGTETVTTYSYSETWSDSTISSANFKKPEGHRNPGSMPYESMQQRSDRVTLGDYMLSASLVGKIQNFEPLSVDIDDSLPPAIPDGARLHDAGFYIGADPSSPQVGDTRIRFRVVKPTNVSVIAKQIDSTFEPYRTKAGGAIELLQTGVHSADEMIRRAQRSNIILTWGLRLAGFLMMFIGLMLLLRPLSVIADVLPILGYIVGAGTGIISFLIAAVLSLMTIAVAWIVYRPLLGIMLFVIVAGLTIAISSKLKTAKAALDQEAPA